MPFNDPTPAHIARLHAELAPLAFYFVNALRDAGIPAYISSSTRTPSIQAKLVRSGRSKTMKSRHLTGRAFDIDILGYGRDDLPRWWWTEIGKFGEGLGMRWGGRFTGFFDAGHFEI